MQTQVIASKKEYRLVGHSVVKKDAAEKATGKILYSSDLHFPDLLIGRILHSPHAHARILSIDTSKAAALPGVKAVVTHDDFPLVRIGRGIRDRYAIARDKVRYIGEPVAAVAAVDEETAEEALALIKVEYQELPAIFDPSKATSPTAPILHDELTHYKTVNVTQPQGNIPDQVKLVRGDVEKAWSQCHLIHEDDYYTPVEYHGFTEPHETTAEVDSTGKITIWTGTKAPFFGRQLVADALGLSMSRIRFATVAVGGDFGGKGTMVQIEPICAMLALKSHQPVRLCLSREEELTSVYLRDATTCHLKIGVNQDGKLVAFQGSITFDTGAYSMHIANMAEACVRLHGPYLIPNVDIVARRVYTNNVPAGDMRGPSDVQCFFALESHLDMIARKLGIDPIQFRLQNAVDNGDKLPTGERIVDPGIKETLRRTQAYLKKEKGVKKPNEGWGIACEEHRGALMDSRGSLKLPRFALASVWVKINEDGSVIVLTGVKEVGGGQNTVAAQLVAETLGVPYDDVTVVAADTDHTPWDQGSGGNEATYRAGLNALLAAGDARNQIIELAAQKMAVSPTEIELQGGRVYVRTDHTKSMTFAEAAALSLRMNGSPVLGTGTGGGVRKAKFAGELPPEKWHDGLQHATHAAKVQVDPDTGKVKVLKYYACHDVGFAISPQNVEGQIEGGVAFGLGAALTEEVIIQDGKTLNANLTDYRLPVALDVPNIECEIVEIPSTAGPLGAKGLGEGTNVPVAPAIANAVYDAIGRRITRLPLTCEKVYQALQEKEDSI